MCLKTSEAVIVALYFIGVCRCLYVPSKSNDLMRDFMDAGKGEKKVQICGDQLTNLLELICQGNFNKMSAGGTSDNGDKLTETCCKRQCPISVLWQFCADPPPTSPPKFYTKPRRPISNDIQRHQNELDMRPQKKINETLSTRSNSPRKSPTRNPEVSVKKKNNKGKRSHTKRRRKTNNHITKKGEKIKTQCVYKSFGHYLLKRDPEIKTRNPIRKKKRNNTALPLQVETIPPNFESLGGMPLVVP